MVLWAQQGARDIDYHKRLLDQGNTTPCTEQYFSVVRVHLQIPKLVPGTNSISLFSVNRLGRTVEMSSGNLQYSTNNNTFRFAPEQTSVVTAEPISTVPVLKKSSRRRAVNTPTIPTTPIWTDDFTWGSSGYNDGTYGPTWDNDTVSPNIDNNSGLSANYDWGYYNEVYGRWATYDSMGNRVGFDSVLFERGLWRTLTVDEWDYMLNGRTMYDGLTPSTFCTIDGEGGLIVFPDKFRLTSVSDETIVGVINNSKSLSERVLTTEQFQLLESLGCIFLPKTDGYWSATASDATDAQCITISSVDGTVVPTSTQRGTGLSVRLARDIVNDDNATAAISRK